MDPNNCALSAKPTSARGFPVQIARDWNAKDPIGKAGLLTKFSVRSAYLARFEIHTVGGSIHKEYGIPAEELPTPNSNIVGNIEVIHEFHAK